MSLAAGHTAEDKAADFLIKQGLKIIARNISYPFGEIDIVALEKQVLVFVEVKHRRHVHFGEPYEAVGKAKQKKIILAARAFLQKRSGEVPLCRFDVVSLSGDLKSPRIEHIADAFIAEE